MDDRPCTSHHTLYPKYNICVIVRANSRISSAPSEHRSHLQDVTSRGRTQPGQGTVLSSALSLFLSELRAGQWRLCDFMAPRERTICSNIVLPKIYSPAAFSWQLPSSNARTQSWWQSSVSGYRAWCCLLGVPPSSLTLKSTGCSSSSSLPSLPRSARLGNDKLTC